MNDVTVPFLFLAGGYLVIQGWWGLNAGRFAAFLGLVLLMYMLRLRRRPVLVSSTMLWQRAVRDIEGNIPWQRLSPSLLLLFCSFSVFSSSFLIFHLLGLRGQFLHLLICENSTS